MVTQKELGSHNNFMTKDTSAELNFRELGIAPKLLEQLNTLSYTTPTPIQHQAIPIAIKGEDVIGIAQTGTGKTLAFAIPMIQRIAQNKQMGLILLPTRELALQVEDHIKKIGNMLNVRTALIIGGADMNKQKAKLHAKPHIIIATPGRLIDHLEQRNISLVRIGVLVLDEADRMLDMGFGPQIKRILETVPQERQTMLFSATMPEKIAQIARTYMKKPLRIEVAQQGTIAERIEQEVFMVQKSEKLNLLATLLAEHTGTVLVFSRTKHGAKKITRFIRDMGHTADELHSNRSLAQRMKALDGFKKGIYRVLVATDIAARGIDVKDISLVLNFDLPENSEDYVHRIGRTARAGKAGKAVSFAEPNQKADIKAIEKLIRAQLTISPLPNMSSARANHRIATHTANFNVRDHSSQRNSPKQSGRGNKQSSFSPSRERAPYGKQKTSRRQSSGQYKTIF